MAAADDREDVALSSAELDSVLSSGGLTEGGTDLPADNLELYGVWVKVKPETVAAKTAPPTELADLEGVDTEESAELTEDEQDLLAELETGSGEPEPAHVGAPLDDDSLTLPEMPALMQEETLTISEEPAPGALDDLSLEEPGGPNLDQEVAALDAEIEAMAPPVETSSSLPSLEEEEIEIGGAQEQTPSLELEDELVLDEPSGYRLDADIDLEAETDSAPAPQETQEPFPTMDEDIILEEPSAPDLTDALSAVEAGVEGTPMPSGGLAELEPAGAFEAETPPVGGMAEDTGFDMEAQIAPPPRLPLGAEPPQADAAHILEKIEQELHAIRREISDLKSELTVLRKERDELAAPGESEEDKAGAGFFGGEEDETIALTGDELDNILSTADVTEAPQESEGPDGELPEVDLGADLGGEPVSMDTAPGIIPEDILERPEVDLDLETDTTGAELSIPEEGLVDASTDEAIQDESSLLTDEPLQGVDLGEPGGAIVETDDQDLAMPDDLAADLAAEAEAAISEPRTDDPGAPATDDLILDTGPDLGTVDLDLEAETPEPPAPELDIELDLGAEEEPSPTETPAAPADMELAIDEEEAPAPAPAEPKAAKQGGEGGAQPVPDDLRDEIKSVLAYLDQLLEALPDEKIEEFAKSEYFGVYKKLFVELGLED